MDYTLFFERNDQLAYSLLRAFSINRNQLLTQDDILTRFDLSDYKLGQLLKMLNNDLATLKSTDNSSIDLIDKALYRGNNISTTVVHELRLKYLERSTNFKLFMYNIMRSNRESKDTFRSENFMSKTKFYAGQLEIRDILTHSNFYKSPSLITDREYVVRLRVFEFLYAAFNGIGSPFHEMDIKVNNLIIKIQSQFNFVIKPIQRVKLGIFIKVWLLRVKNKNPINTTIIPSDNFTRKLKDQLFNIRAAINQYFNLKLSNDELNYLYTFLVTQQYLPGIETVLDKQNFPLAYRITDQLIDEISSTNVLVNVNALNLEKLRRTLNAIHLRFTTFYVEPTTFISLDEIKFFKETYPIFHTIINQFVQQLAQNTRLSLGKHESANLYFDYMFTLINCIPKELLHDKVYICVDFSQGEMYTEYIIKTLQGFRNASLMITTNITAQTDIYLSDFYNSGIKQQQMIWRNPPTPDDWAILGDYIINIKQRKVASLVKDIEAEASK